MKTIVTMALLAGSAATPLLGQDFELRRELAPGSRFVIRNIIGDVRVEGATGRTLDVTGQKKEGRHGDPEDVEIRTVEISGGVAVCVFYPGQSSSRSRRDDDDRRPAERDRDARDYDRDDDRPSRRTRREGDDPCRTDGNWSNNNRNDTSVDFVIRLPAGLRAEIRTVAGDVIANGLRGRLELATVSGDLTLTDAQAEVLEASSVSGDVELDRITARDVSAETVSGDVTFVGPIDRDGSYDFRTLSGDVIVTVPREPDARVSASTFSGRLVSDFPVNMDGRRRRNRFNATWGAGTASIDLESFSGDVRIKSAGSR